MPALSPTMTEGNIAKWSVKEGESFSAGDVLLEIETDKATMDVEAQDDGVMMKIMQGDGAKSVQVGTRIGVIAEPGDDISSLEIPPDESPAPKGKSTSAASEQKAKAEESKPAEQKPAAVKKSSVEVHEQKYPLLPSVAQLVAENGLDKAAVSQITPTGPNGRLLKGDVLAYLGSISAERPAAISNRFEQLSHLDLSNIKVAERKAPSPSPPPPPAPPAEEKKPVTPVIEDLEVAVPISLSKVIEVQKKIQETIGVFMPLSVFISRATEAANDDLPPSSATPSADDLFNQVLGLDKLQPKGTRGFYLPQVVALPHSSMLTQPTLPSRKQDIIDILAGPRKKSRTPSAIIPGISTGVNIFSVVVPKGEAKRATVFLERVKVILEKEPGRLVL
jgi:Biotin-requiring enzyme/e3 binding domain